MVSKQSFVSYAVFLMTLVVVLISSISVIFPAFIPRYTSTLESSQVNTFEPGTWATHFLAANIIFLGVGILYYKKSLPHFILKSITWIFNFEVSQKKAFLTVAILLAIYISFSIGELASEEEWDDYIRAKNAAENWTFDGGNGLTFGFKYLLLHGSILIFHNIRVVPLIASIAMLVLTYLITVQISKKRFAGIVSIIILLQSHVFLEYDTTASYSNFWVLLYLLSLYLIYKAWFVSPISFIFSVFAKELTIIFLPMTLFFIYCADLTRKKKIQTTVFYLIITLAGIVISIQVISHVPNIAFEDYDFWNGFTTFANYLRFDGLVLLFLLPLTVALFAVSKKVPEANSIMFLIMGILLHAPLLIGFTDYTNQPYRFVTLVVFFAIGVGTILSKRD